MSIINVRVLLVVAGVISASSAQLYPNDVPPPCQPPYATSMGNANSNVNVNQNTNQNSNQNPNAGAGIGFEDGGFPVTGFPSNNYPPQRISQFSPPMLVNRPRLPFSLRPYIPPTVKQDSNPLISGFSNSMPGGANDMLFNANADSNANTNTNVNSNSNNNNNQNQQQQRYAMPLVGKPIFNRPAQVLGPFPTRPIPSGGVWGRPIQPFGRSPNLSGFPVNNLNANTNSNVNVNSNSNDNVNPNAFRRKMHGSNNNENINENVNINSNTNKDDDE